MVLEADIAAFAASLPPEGRLLGLDHGSKTIGLALSDVRRTLASPLFTIRRTKLATDMAALREVITKQAVAGLVVGYPLNMDGSEGARCQSVRAFVRNLEAHCDLPILLHDERLSSAEANDAMLMASLTRSRRAEKIDKVAAALILQGALDAL